jgi:hypothetical protein
MAREYTKEQVETAVINSKTFSDVFRHLGVNVNGGSYKWLKKLILKHNIDTSHFFSRKEILAMMTAKSNGSKGKTLYSKDDISKDGRIPSERLRSFMTFKNIEHKCNVCGLQRWLDKPIRLDIDHIDGNCINNHINNLQYICPNCHRQKTIQLKEEIDNKQNVKISSVKEKRKYQPIKSFECVDCNTKIEKGVTRCWNCYNNTRYKIEWPSKEMLEKIIWEKPTSVLSKELGVADTAIAKRCRKLGITKPPRGYWQKIGCPDEI